MWLLWNINYISNVHFKSPVGEENGKLNLSVLVMFFWCRFVCESVFVCVSGVDELGRKETRYCCHNMLNKISIISCAEQKQWGCMMRPHTVTLVLCVLSFPLSGKVEKRLGQPTWILPCKPHPSCSPCKYLPHTHRAIIKSNFRCGPAEMAKLVKVVAELTTAPTSVP